MDLHSDIYDNLPTGVDLCDEIDKLQLQNKLLKEHIQSLERDVEKLCLKITEMKNTQNNLERNISELYKTAKVEIARKDKTISELRSQLDTYNTQSSYNSSMKRRRDISPGVRINDCKRVRKEEETSARNSYQEHFDRQNRYHEWYGPYQRNHVHKHDFAEKARHGNNRKQFPIRDDRTMGDFHSTVSERKGERSVSKERILDNKGAQKSVYRDQNHEEKIINMQDSANKEQKFEKKTISMQDYRNKIDSHVNSIRVSPRKKDNKDEKIKFLLQQKPIQNEKSKTVEIIENMKPLVESSPQFNKCKDSTANSIKVTTPNPEQLTKPQKQKDEKKAYENSKMSEEISIKTTSKTQGAIEKLTDVEDDKEYINNNTLLKRSIYNKIKFSIATSKLKKRANKEDPIECVNQQLNEEKNKKTSKIEPNNKNPTKLVEEKIECEQNINKIESKEADRKENEKEHGANKPMNEENKEKNINELPSKIEKTTKLDEGVDKEDKVEKIKNKTQDNVDIQKKNENVIKQGCKDDIKVAKIVKNSENKTRDNAKKTVENQVKRDEKTDKANKIVKDTKIRDGEHTEKSLLKVDGSAINDDKTSKQNDKPKDNIPVKPKEKTEKSDSNNKKDVENVDSTKSKKEEKKTDRSQEAKSRGKMKQLKSDDSRGTKNIENINSEQKPINMETDSIKATKNRDEKPTEIVENSQCNSKQIIEGEKVERTKKVEIKQRKDKSVEEVANKLHKKLKEESSGGTPASTMHETVEEIEDKKTEPKKVDDPNKPSSSEDAVKKNKQELKNKRKKSPRKNSRPINIQSSKTNNAVSTLDVTSDSENVSVSIECGLKNEKLTKSKKEPKIKRKKSDDEVTCRVLRSSKRKQDDSLGGHESVSLSHDGEIPVLHIGEMENVTLDSVTVEMLREDLNLSFDHSSEVISSTPVQDKTSSISNTSSTRSTCSSSPKKRRRAILTMID